MLAEVREFGLQGRVDPLSRPEIVDLILRSRQALRPFLSAPALASYIEPFAVDRFNSQSTLGENLLFGTPVGPTFLGDGLARHPVIRGVLPGGGDRGRTRPSWAGNRANPVGNGRRVLRASASSTPKNWPIWSRSKPGCAATG